MIRKIILAFTLWRITLFLIAFYAIRFIPDFKRVFPYIDQVLNSTKMPPWVWSFGNFDGVHYLRIAQNGYDSQYSQAFFPLFPLAIQLFNGLNIFKNPLLDTHIFVLPSYFFTAIILSNIFFVAALLVFYRLIRLDFNQKTSFKSIVLLLVFPTSFYFGSIYTESLFLLLTTTTFYFLRKNNFLLASFFAALSSATRIIGILFLLIILVEFFVKIKKGELKFDFDQLIKLFISLLITPFGILLYMLFLRMNFDNPFYFISSQPFFGAGRSGDSLILLPQVLIRYIKIFITVPINSSLFLTAFSEFSFTLVILTTLLFYYKKIRLSYFIFILGSLLIPTLTGTLSSMPRYSLMAFLLIPFVVRDIDRYYKLLVIVLAFVGIILTSFFTRGYWIA